MKNNENKNTLATEIIKEQKSKLYIYKISSATLLIINIILLIILFLKRG